MMAAATLMDQVERSEQVSRELARARADARVDVVSLIRQVEKRIVKSLDGGVLKGSYSSRLPNLMPSFGQPLHAVRLRGKPEESLPEDGRAVLVMLEHGTFVMAKRDLDNYDGVTLRASVTPAKDSDFIAQDIHHVMKNVATTLSIHVELTQKSVERYDEFAWLADRLTVALR